MLCHQVEQAGDDDRWGDGRDQEAERQRRRQIEGEEQGGPGRHERCIGREGQDAQLEPERARPSEIVP